VTDLDVRLDPLLEDAGPPRFELPAELEAAYGGSFGLPEELVYGNFVTSVDGVAAIGGVRESSAAISGGEPADRFVMALLRSAADVVVVGSGTLKEHAGPWTAGRAFPAGVGLFRRARAAIASTVDPTLVVVTASGALPLDHPALGTAVVVTTSAGAGEIVERGIACAEVIDLGEADEVDPRATVEWLRDRGHRRILTEGGPSLMGSMLEASVVDQLFLTISPTMIGGGPGRQPLSDETDLRDPDRRLRLMSVRRSEGYLFLRYAIEGTGSPEG
jgi:riboflavin biosynthesis pyrimidine reductase